jgi:hypothetical protein
MTKPSPEATLLLQKYTNVKIAEKVVELEADNAALQKRGEKLYKLLYAGFRVVNVGGHLSKQWLLDVKEALEAGGE